MLETTLQSEVAGQAIAEVSEDVYDADRMGRLLIPAGTKVVGVYKRSGGLDFQRRRLDLVWTEMTLPDGRQLALADAGGMDAAGSMGVGGEVHTRWGELVATAALLTVFDAVQRSTVGNGTGLLDSAQGAASRQGGELGREVTRKVLSWEPDITVPGGTPIIIAPQKTVQVCWADASGLAQPGCDQGALAACAAPLCFHGTVRPIMILPRRSRVR